MAKDIKGKSRGATPVTGYESEVRSLRQRLTTLKWMTAEAEADKARFRKLAALVAADNPEATSFEFVDPMTDSKIGVSLPDARSPGNRLNLKPERLAAFAQKGLEVEGLLETEESYSLRGEYAVWFGQLLAQWKEQGVELPSSGLKHNVVTRLSADGVGAAQAVASDREDSRNVAAAELLDIALKAATVK